MFKVGLCPAVSIIKILFLIRLSKIRLSAVEYSFKFGVNPIMSTIFSAYSVSNMPINSVNALARFVSFVWAMTVRKTISMILALIGILAIMNLSNRSRQYVIVRSSDNKHSRSITIFLLKVRLTFSFGGYSYPNTLMKFCMGSMRMFAQSIM